MVDRQLSSMLTFLVFLLHALISNGEDPCLQTVYKNLADTWRLDNNKGTSFATAKDDSSLLPGWYRFTVKGGTGLISTISDINSPWNDTHNCGTVSPLVMIGDHPQPGETVGRKLCEHYQSSVQGKADCFPAETTIKVKNCNSFFVYELVTAVPYAAYCVESGKNKVLLDLNLDGNPVLSKPIVSDKGYNFTCSFRYTKPNAEYVTFNVTWLFGGKGELAIKPDVQEKQSGTFVATLEHDQLEGKIGKELSCRVHAQSSTETGAALHSSAYPLELRAYSSRSQVYESEKAPTEVIVESTVPLICDDGDTCEMDLLVSDPELLAVEDSCQQQLNQMKWNAENNLAKTKFKLNTVQNYNNGRQKSKVVNLSIQVRNQKNRKRAKPFYTFPGVLIETIKNETKTCNPWGDPHYKSFDNSGQYNNYQVGEYVMYTNEDDDVEVQVRHTGCGRASCICAFAVRDGVDVVKVDVCRGFPKIVYDSKSSNDGFRIFKSRNGKEYKVYTPSGNYVSAQTSVFSRKLYMNVNLQKAKKDENVKGVCGNANGISTDDFIGPKGNKITPRRRNYPDEFFNEWKVGKKSLLSNTNVPPGTAKKVLKPLCRCPQDGTMDCSTTNAYMSPQIARDKADHRWMEVTDSLKLRQRGRRSTYRQQATMEQGMNNYRVSKRDVINWPTQSGITEAEAKLHCMNLFTGQKSDICFNATRLNKTSFIESCISDILYTDSFEMTHAATNALDTQCINAIIDNDLSPVDNDGQVNLPGESTKTFCPNQCSNHGICYQGTCYCDDGFDTEDCSFESKKAPTFIDFVYKNNCDVEKEPCTSILVIADNIQENDELSCRFEDVGKAETKAEFESFREIACNVPPGFDVLTGKSMKTVKISITNDRKLFSESKPFTFFKSQCVDCTPDGLCKEKANICIIHGQCFSAGDSNPNDSTLFCRPSTSTRHWVDAAGGVHS